MKRLIFSLTLIAQAAWAQGTTQYPCQIIQSSNSKYTIQLNRTDAGQKEGQFAVILNSDNRNITISYPIEPIDLDIDMGAKAKNTMGWKYADTEKLGFRTSNVLISTSLVYGKKDGHILFRFLPSSYGIPDQDRWEMVFARCKALR